MSSKKIFYLLFILFYVVAVLTRLYWMEQKAGLHMDEYWSILAANYNKCIIEENFEFNKFYSGNELKYKTLCDNASFKDAMKDILLLYGENRDSPHTNLYYSLLRISLIGLETANFKDIVIRGTVLNLLFFTLSYIFFFLLMRLIFKDDYMSLIAVFCTFMSTAALSNTIYLRPYQVQEALFIIFAYIVLKMLIHFTNKIIQSEDSSFININFKLLIYTTVITGLTLLTGYYTMIYVFLFGFFIVWYNIKENKLDKKSLKNEIIFYCMALFGAVLVANALYSHYLLGYIGYRAYGTMHTIAGFGFFNNLSNSIITTLEILHKHYFNYYVIGSVVIVSIYVLMAKNKLNFSVQHIGLLLISLIFAFVVTYIAPYKVLRYLMPITPFLIVLPIILLHSIKKNLAKIVFSILFLFAFTISAYNEPNMEYLFKDFATELEFTKNTNVPVLIINDDIPCWGYLNMIIYLNDKQLYVFTDNSKDINKNITILHDFNEFYIVICRKPIKELMSINEMMYSNVVSGDYEIIEEYDAGYSTDINEYSYKCFKVRR